MGLEEDYQKAMKDLNSTQEKLKKKIIPLKNSIDWLIKNKIHNKSFIEKILNSLLEPSILGIGNDEFHRLNEFYFTFLPQSSNAYKKLYEKVCGRNY